MKLNNKEFGVFKKILNDMISSKSLLPRYLGKVEDDCVNEDWSNYCFASWITNGELVIASNDELVSDIVRVTSKSVACKLPESSVENIGKALRVFSTGEFIKLLVNHEPELKAIKTHRYI